MRLTIPTFGPEEIQAVEAVLESGNLTQGPMAGEFEGAVRDYVGTKHALATSSCTTALHLCLVALGVGPGDEIIIPDFTYPATANVVAQIGAVPILVDIDPATFNVDLVDLESRISQKTRAIMPVHAFGLCANIEAIVATAHARNIPVVEDAACALGAEELGQRAGSFGDLACFSFHPRKSITTGEGGMITSSSTEIMERLRILASHGGRRGELFLEFEEPGFNYRMSDINAAIGVVQMRRLEWILGRRREIAALYIQELARTSAVQTPDEPLGYRHTYQSFVVTLSDDINRDSVIHEMRSRGIETTLGTYAVHAQPYYRKRFGYAPGDLPASFRAFNQTLTLPLSPHMTGDEVSHVSDQLMCSLSR